MTIRLVAPLAALLSLIACGKGPDDPLTATWSNASCFGDAAMPADIQSCETALRFDADLKFTLIDTRQSAPATAVYPRCSAIRTVAGLTYSTDSVGTLTLSGNSASTLERKNCVNDSDNQPAMPDSRDSVAAERITYSIKDRTLSVTSGPLRGDYVKK